VDVSSTIVLYFLTLTRDLNTVHGLAKFPERNTPEIFQALNNPNQYLQGDRYNVTKMLDLLLTRQLAKSPAVDPDVIVCSVNPNFCKSELMRDTPKIVRV
jgi:retinol dehydrogenase-12